MKRCPYCDEKIRDKAIVCRYCKRDLPVNQVEPKVKLSQTKGEKGTKQAQFAEEVKQTEIGSAKLPIKKKRGHINLEKVFSKLIALYKEKNKLTIVITMAVVILVTAGICLTFGCNLSLFTGRTSTLAEIDGNPIRGWEKSSRAYKVRKGVLTAHGRSSEENPNNILQLDVMVNENVNDYVELTYSGMLLSKGKPQSGTGISLRAGYGSGSFALNIQNGFIKESATNQHSISLSTWDNKGEYDLIIAPFVPEYDQEYQVRAIRSNNGWFLFVNDELVGSAEDPGGLGSIASLHLASTGSVQVHSIKIRTQPRETAPSMSQANETCKILFYQRDSERERINYVMDMDGRNVEKLSDAAYDKMQRSTLITHEGTQAIRYRYNDEDEAEILLCPYPYDESLSGECIYITDTLRDSRSANWSPDDSKIVFQSNMEDDYDLFMINADGTHKIQLTFNNGEDSFPRWSPDGKYIAYKANMTGKTNIYILNMLTMEISQLTDNERDDYSPKWSADSKHVLFIRQSTTGEGDFEIYSVAIDDKEITQITENDVGDYLLSVVCE